MQSGPETGRIDPPTFQSKEAKPVNDHYRDLLRQYLTAINDLAKHPICQIKALEARLWEAIGERPSEGTGPLRPK